MTNVAENDDILAGILRTAEKHPNSNASKLIQETQRVPTIRNIVLLLNEIVQNVEYANNFDISLQYYLNLYQTLSQNACNLNEAGMLLESSAKIYDRRVDIVLDMVHAQLTSLRETTNENSKPTDQENTMQVATEKVKRTRKRVVENIKDPCDVEMELKKFRKLSSEKRFVEQTTVREELRRLATINKQCRRINTDEMDFIHPAACLHSVMPDLDTEGEFDTKRHYKLFMHHVEHRYNTLVPDINFRLHFLMKDFIDEEQERTSDDETPTPDVDNRNWPPLSQAYVEKYVNLENQVLRLEHNLLFPIVETPAEFDTQHFLTSNDVSSPLLADKSLNCSPNVLNSFTQDSGYFSSTNATEDEITLSNRISLNATEDLTNRDETFSADLSRKDSSIERSGITITEEFSKTFNDLDYNKENIMKLIESRVEKVLFNSRNMLLNRCEYVDLSKVKVSLPSMRGGSVLFTELDAKTHRMLSPKVVAYDILASEKAKEDSTIIMTESLKEVLSVLDFLELNEDDIRQLNEDALSRPQIPEKIITPTLLPPITLNIMKFEHKLLRKQVLFKLGSDMDLFIQARSLKRPKRNNDEAQSTGTQRQLKQFCAEDLRQMPSAYDYESDDDFMGFPDNLSDFGDFCGFNEKDGRGGEEDRFVENKLQVLEGVYEKVAETANEQETAEIVEKDTTSEAETTAIDCESTCLLEGETHYSQNTTESDKPAETTKTTGNTVTENDSDEDREENGINAANNDVLNNVDEELRRIEGTSCDKMTNVQEWHSSLRQHLANARERHHFDVFNIGTEIMNGLQSSESDAEKKSVYTFQDVMQDKDESYVSRYFLSSLLLINQNNIELSVTNKNSEKPAKWSDLKFKLLSTKRHTVSIEDNIGMVVRSNSNTNDDEDVTHKTKTNIEKDNEHKTKTTTATAMTKTKRKNILSSTFNMEDDNNDSFNNLELSALANSTATTTCPIILHSSFEHVKINVDIIKPVKQVYKKLQTSDDHDSGFYTASLKSNKTFEQI